MFIMSLIEMVLCSKRESSAKEADISHNSLLFYDSIIYLRCPSSRHFASSSAHGFDKKPLRQKSISHLLREFQVELSGTTIKFSYTMKDLVWVKMIRLTQ